MRKKTPRTGVNFRIPEGTPVHSMRDGGWTPAPRNRNVKPCEINRYGEWLTVTWSGSGGYWRRVVQHKGEFVGRFPS